MSNFFGADLTGSETDAAVRHSYWLFGGPPQLDGHHLKLT
jgi:hypothetical protein